MTSITLVTTAFHDDSEKAKAAAEQINRMLHGKALDINDQGTHQFITFEVIDENADDWVKGINQLGYAQVAEVS
jgi:tyrosine-protein phosphatase YwqE